MDDLISREITIKVLESKKKGFKDCISKEEVKLNREWNKAIDECISELQNQPIAYDVDKVVEEIEEVLQDLNVLEIMCHFDSDSAIQSDLDNFLQAIKNEIMRRLKAGYNACIDEILGGGE